LFNFLELKCNNKGSLSQIYFARGLSDAREKNKKSSIVRFYTHGYADRTALSRGRAQSASSHHVPFHSFSLTQVFGVEHERPASLRPVPLQEELTLSVTSGDGCIVVHRNYVHVAPAVVLRPVFRSGVLVEEILKTGRQRFRHLVGSCVEKTENAIIISKQR